MKTAAEYQRDYRERQKEKRLSAGDPTDALPGVKFHEYVEEDGNWTSGVVAPLDWAGLSDGIPYFDDDTDPGHDPENDGPYRGSIGRAERMIDCLMDAASELASIVNRYKRQKVEREEERLHAIADASTSADERRQVLKQLVELNRLADRLKKTGRRDYQAFQLKGA